MRAAIGFAGIALLAVPRMLARRARVIPDARALLYFAAYGILGFALFELVFFAALERTTVSIAVALLYTAPAFVVLMSRLLWRERVGGMRMAALAMVLLGVILVTGAAGSLVRGTASLPLSALLLGIASGFGYALYTMFSKVATERYGTLASLLWSFFFAAVALALFASPITPLQRAPQHVPALIALGIVPTIVPYALYLAGLRILRASTAAMLASLEPVVAVVLAAALLHERLDALQLIGMALVVAAAILVARRMPA